jgi:hypothetical protein
VEDVANPGVDLDVLVVEDVAAQQDAKSPITAHVLSYRVIFRYVLRMYDHIISFICIYAYK